MSGKQVFYFTHSERYARMTICCKRDYTLRLSDFFNTQLG